MNELKITLVQTDLIWEDIDANINHLKLLLDDDEHTDIIVLPEMFTTGFSMNTNALAKESYEKGIWFMKEVSFQKNCAICASLMCYEDGKYFNRFVWVNPGGDFLFYDKRHLFSMADEHNHFTKGEGQLIISYKEWKINPLVCYDLRFPVWSRNNSKDPYDLLIYVANWPVTRITQWSKLLQARAIENVCFVIGVNRIGSDEAGIKYNGLSAYVDYKGDAHILTEDKEETRIVTLNKSALLEYRERFPFLNDADDFKIQMS
jgi:omega-amidase